jgi:hypothetical protein
MCRTRCERVLIDRDIPTPIDDPPHSSMNVFLGCCRGLKTALVSHHLTAAASIQSVTDLNAGRGIAVAYFDTREKAEQWLLETDHPAYAEIDRRPPCVRYSLLSPRHSVLHLPDNKGRKFPRTACTDLQFSTTY